MFPNNVPANCFGNKINIRRKTFSNEKVCITLLVINGMFHDGMFRDLKG